MASFKPTCFPVSCFYSKCVLLSTFHRLLFLSCSTWFLFNSLKKWVLNLALVLRRQMICLLRSSLFVLPKEKKSHTFLTMLYLKWNLQAVNQRHSKGRRMTRSAAGADPRQPLGLLACPAQLHSGWLLELQPWPTFFPPGRNNKRVVSRTS